MLDKDTVMSALAEVNDPELHKSLVELKMVRAVHVTGRDVKVEIALTTGACPLKGSIVDAVRDRLEQVDGIGKIEVDLGEMSQEERQALFGTQLNAPILTDAHPARIFGIASGKGGVGKSTVTVNLATALRRMGHSVGILDCDIYGFSVPRMVGVEGRRPTVIDGKMIPIPAHGMKVMSMGNLVDEGTPVVWRGPMLGKILRQFLNDVVWGDLDFLLLDLPPGTGDMALDVAQLIKKAQLVIVTTPQVVAAGVASRAAQMARRTDQRIVGVIENMSAFLCPHCGEPTPIFGEGGGQVLADDLKVPLLGQIPLTLEARTMGDKGTPVALADNSPAAKAYADLASKIAQDSGGVLAG